MSSINLMKFTIILILRYVRFKFIIDLNCIITSTFSLINSIIFCHFRFRTKASKKRFKNPMENPTIVCCPKSYNKGRLCRLAEWVAFLHTAVMTTVVLCRVRYPACTARELPWIGVLHKWNLFERLGFGGAPKILGS